MDISYTEVSSGSGGPIWIDLTHDDDDEPARPACAPPTPLASRPSVLQFMRKFVKRTDAADGGGDADDESDGGSGPSKRYELKSSFLSEISHRRTRSPPRLAQKGTALGSFGRQERVGSALTKRDKPPHLPSRFVSAGTVLPVNPPTPSRRCLPDDSSSCDELTDVEAALDRFSDEDDAGYRR
ncbi:hypothetical protein FA95DRAFT_1552366 [Auriscalpium vulgare]|uniref:Uncharacterized protein n=1 Tax=Auriscalpium vulgare TaxID=40419 RepID=A0ACB8SBI6_9AGAM|nr:hypothetical protein FA95DRAFT_1552366 [Auriscalpium vulgare]